jgi:hypothetical protein
VALIDYETLVLTVRELIAGTGRTVTFGTLSSAASDASKPWKPTGAPVTTDSPATFVPISSATELGLAIVDDELLRRAEQVCIVAPHETVDLSLSNTILDNSLTWRVEWVSVLKPGDATLLLAFGIRH